MDDDHSAGAQRLRLLFRLFAARQCHGRSAVYEALSNAVADDGELLDLVLSAPADQRRPSLLFAAVNLILAARPGSELAGYYPVHGGSRPPDGQLFPAFRDFCAGHRGELIQVLREGSTQTNDIRRCVALRLGLDQVQRHWPGPVALAEAGASAGLNLLFDRYRYLLGGRDEPSPVSSPVLVTCEVRGGPPGGLKLGPLPRVTRRLGIDLRPLDLADPAARAWLEAFIWPEQAADLATLRAAITLAQSATDAPVLRADAAADTARLLHDLPGSEPVVLFTASLLSYLGADARASFTGQIQQAARERPVAWVFAETPGLAATAGLRAPALAGPLARDPAVYAVGVSLHGPLRRDAVIAVADPYLRWVTPEPEVSWWHGRLASG